VSQVGGREGDSFASPDVQAKRIRDECARARIGTMGLPVRRPVGKLAVEMVARRLRLNMDWELRRTEVRG